MFKKIGYIDKKEYINDIKKVIEFRDWSNFTKIVNDIFINNKKDYSNIEIDKYEVKEKNNKKKNNKLNAT